MSHGNRPTTLQQRLEIWERAQRGETDPQIAAAMQVSVKTVEKHLVHHRAQMATTRSAPRPGWVRVATRAASQWSLEPSVPRVAPDHPGLAGRASGLGAGDAASGMPSRSTFPRSSDSESPPVSGLPEGGAPNAGV